MMAPKIESSSVSPTNGTNYVSLIEKIRQRSKSTNDGLPFFSIEFFPPQTNESIGNLISCFDNFRQYEPLFADITWHANQRAIEGVEFPPSIRVANLALNYCFLDTMLHLTCVGMTKSNLLRILEQAKEIGLRNILALRGDQRPHLSMSDFHYASDLIHFIKQQYGDYFTIAVAGYPNAHPESPSKEQDLKYLKHKVDAGADFIITQMFFESKYFIQFVRDCQKIGIEVPILPGIMTIQTHDSFEKIIQLSKLILPAKMLEDIEMIKMNDEAIRNYGIEWTVRMCREIIEANVTPGLHFYTLNMQHATLEILRILKLGKCGGLSTIKSLPWLAVPVNHRRCSETVRPIFWSSRPKSYVQRTQDWNIFPNGRWGKVDSPAFGTLNDYHLFMKPRRNQEKLRQMWGLELEDEHDVWKIFHCYLTKTPNKFGFQIDSMPWSEDSVLRPETDIIIERLARLNEQGILTINSQPNINGIRSSDEVFGWGSPNGYVYQKAYVEFFISEKHVKRLLNILSDYKLVNYQIINQEGTIFYTNCHETDPVAVTWGVFPGKEIVQPTIVDIISFKVWKNEAFGLWLDSWAELYPEQSRSRQVIESIYKDYYLVNLVDNDYPSQTCLWDLLDKVVQ